jgi:hypothetical protein
VINGTHFEGAPHRRSLLKKACPRRIGRTKGGLNSKPYAACDGVVYKMKRLVLLDRFAGG